MDRLSIVIAAVVVTGAAGCEAKTAEAPPAPTSRTDVAKVAAPQAVSTESFCDLHATDASGTAFSWPKLASDTPPGPPTTWRWVNVWATWCKPCVEEMPRIVAWKEKLAAAGKKVDLQFVSVDDNDADVAAFRASHPATPPSMRVTSAAERAAWLKTFQLDDGAIPIQLFVSPANKLRCARAGGVRDKDYAVIDKLFTE
jgi:thiol-disulfide isomerase/thioredoxin